MRLVSPDFSLVVNMELLYITIQLHIRSQRLFGGPNGCVWEQIMNTKTTLFFVPDLADEPLD